MRAMLKGPRRSHYHIYRDLKWVSTHQDRQEAWRRVAALSVRYPDDTGWTVCKCSTVCRPHLRPII